jgi:hypothetical protein
LSEIFWNDSVTEFDNTSSRAAANAHSTNSQLAPSGESLAP